MAGVAPLLERIRSAAVRGAARAVDNSVKSSPRRSPCGGGERCGLDSEFPLWEPDVKWT